MPSQGDLGYMGIQELSTIGDSRVIGYVCMGQGWLHREGDI